MAPPVVFITRASSGIGRATAKLVAKNSYRVFGTSRRLEAAPSLPGVEFVALDVRDDASVEAAVAKVLDKAGRIDVLVNNAGYTILGAIEETSPAEALALFDTNVFGVLRVSPAALPAMRRQGARPHRQHQFRTRLPPGPVHGPIRQLQACPRRPV